MAWKRGVGLLVALVLTGLPVSAAVCAVRCDTAAHQQGLASSCHESVHDSAVVRIASISIHDCSDHDATLGELTAAGSAWLGAPDAATASLVRQAAPAQTSADAHAPSSPPSDTAPPRAHPLVLRI